MLVEDDHAYINRKTSTLGWGRGNTIPLPGCGPALYKLRKELKASKYSLFFVLDRKCSVSSRFKLLLPGLPIMIDSDLNSGPDQTLSLVEEIASQNPLNYFHQGVLKQHQAEKLRQWITPNSGLIMVNY